MSLVSQIKNIKFDHVTGMSEFIAKEYNSKFDDVISSSTLRRNKYYRKILDDYIDGKASSRNELARLREDLLLEQLNSAELQKSLETSERTISELLTNQANNKSLEFDSRIHGKELPVDERPFVMIMRIIDQIGGMEVKKEAVYDLASIREPKQIFTSDDFPEFFDWYFSKKGN